MDFELYGKAIVALYLLVLVIQTGGSFAANNGQSYWATKSMAGGSVGMTLSFGVLALAIFLEESGSFEGALVFALAFFTSSLLFLIGLIAFAAKFGATCRRTKELEEITAALAATVDAEQRAAQANPTTQ
ncbi:MAG: hypothetical protein Q7Q71_14705 [Verrucomicrobiota bacterium JB023]|nr:hypothetical protein [Verrucomicrobiota bacterium JB023]